jgi:hypothetical protein
MPQPATAPRYHRLLKPVALLLAVVVGLQPIVIQSAAWASMLFRYSEQSGSVLQGLETTFDGEHPCALCLLAEERSADEGDPQSGSRTKLKQVELYCQHTDTLLLTHSSQTLPRERDSALELPSRDEAPEPPPPRGRV